jgi:glycerophosphoryl diester phosphodiesterase
MEQPTINLNVNFMPDIKEPTFEEMANRISEMLKDRTSASLRM